MSMNWNDIAFYERAAAWVHKQVYGHMLGNILSIQVTILNLKYAIFLQIFVHNFYVFAEFNRLGKK